MIKLIRESSWSTLLLGSLVIVAFAGFWTAAQSRKQITEYERELELRELRVKELITITEVQQKELREKVPVEVIKYIDREVPGPIRIREVIKWKTKRVEVPVERVREVVEWRDVVCNDLDWEVPEFDGYVEGHVTQVDTRHGNTVVTGNATCYLNDVAVIDDAPFDFDATNAWREAEQRLPVKRWYVGAQIGLRLDDIVAGQYIFNGVSNDLSVAPADVRVYGGARLFPRKKYTPRIGLHVDEFSAGLDLGFDW